MPPEERLTRAFPLNIDTTIEKKLNSSQAAEKSVGLEALQLFDNAAGIQFCLIASNDAK